MRKWIAVACFCVAGLVGWSQQDEAAKANTLYRDGKKLDALPLYEGLAKAHPKEWLYEERLADCLAAKSAQTDDAAEATALRTRMKEAARQAVALGDPNYFVQVMANMDPVQPTVPASTSPGASLLREAEKAYTAGDFDTAMTKYTAAADADPQLYEAPLFAGDTAYVQKDLKAAATWLALAIAIDPNRETAYRYWGDALLRFGSDPMTAREKFIDAVVAEPYNKLAWQGLKQWAQSQKAVILAPRIDRPAGPVVDPDKPKNITINIDPVATDEKKHPGASAWMMYSLMRASYQGDLFHKNFPDEKQYRHTLREEDSALSMVAITVSGKKIKPDKLDESLRNLVELEKAGMLDCWILISAADSGIEQDYAAYRKEHRQLLHDYVARFVVHGGVSSTE